MRVPGDHDGEADLARCGGAGGARGVMKVAHAAKSYWKTHVLDGAGAAGER